MSVRRDISLGRAGNLAGSFEKQLGRSLRPTLVKAMKLAGKQSITVLVGRTRLAPKAYADSPLSRTDVYASGKLMASWDVDHEISHKGGSWELSATVFNHQLHTVFQDAGVAAKSARMGPLAVSMIERWIAQRGIVSLLGESPRRLAKRIVMAMNRRKLWRIEPRTMIARSVVRVREIFYARIKEALTKAAGAA